MPPKDLASLTKYWLRISVDEFKFAKCDIETLTPFQIWDPDITIFLAFFRGFRGF